MCRKTYASGKENNRAPNRATEKEHPGNNILRQIATPAVIVHISALPLSQIQNPTTKDFDDVTHAPFVIPGSTMAEPAESTPITAE